VAKPHRNPPHIQWLRSPPDMKSASAAVITTRSNRALSRLKSTTATKNTASTRIRLTLVIVVINSSLRSKHNSESRHLQMFGTEEESVVLAAHFRSSRIESPRSWGSPDRAKPEGRRLGVERAQIHGGVTQVLHARS